MNYRWIWFVIPLLALGVFLRTYNRADAMYYMNDQGLLLLTADQAVFHRIVPRVGPPISVPGAFIPPFMYYLVGLFMRIGSDPLAVACGYIVLNMAASVLLFMWASMVVNVQVGVTTLALVMLSASLVENGRSIWQAHPTYFFVALYLTVTEVAVRRKNLSIYGAGLFVYTLSCGFYPTPLLLLPFVLAQTVVHVRAFGGALRRRGVSASVLLVGGLLFSVFLPWVTHERSVVEGLAGSLVGLIQSATFSFSGIVTMFYVYASIIVHDLFQLQMIIPLGLVGSVWVKCVVGLGLLFAASSVRKSQSSRFIREFFRSPYVWLLLGVGIPASVGLRMPAYRFSPLYPFIFVALAWLITSWGTNRRWIRRVMVGILCAVFLYGNMRSWWQTTIAHPRMDYPFARRMAEYISRDVVSRQIPVSDIGVHYVTPLDSYDYYASPVYYLLHQSIGYPLVYTPLGNELQRGILETHAVFYLVCDGFRENEVAILCVQPILTRWPKYIQITQRKIFPASSIVVFEKNTP